MAQNKPQTYANHIRLVPMYHGVLFSIVAINLLWTGWQLFKSPGAETVMSLLVAIALCLLFWYARIFPLAAQDRLIRLEERLRLARVLPEDLEGRIGELSEAQLIGLRFAADDEVAGLVRQVLAGKLTRPAEIKKAIKNWRPDTFRV